MGRMEKNPWAIQAASSRHAAKGHAKTAHKSVRRSIRAVRSIYFLYRSMPSARVSALAFTVV